MVDSTKEEFNGLFNSKFYFFESYRKVVSMLHLLHSLIKEEGRVIRETFDTMEKRIKSLELLVEELLQNQSQPPKKETQPQDFTKASSIMDRHYAAYNDESNPTE